jgi:hypothetical protein
MPNFPTPIISMLEGISDLITRRLWSTLNGGAGVNIYLNIHAGVPTLFSMIVGLMFYYQIKVTICHYLIYLKV